MGLASVIWIGSCEWYPDQQLYLSRSCEWYPGSGHHSDGVLRVVSQSTTCGRDLNPWYPDQQLADGMWVTSKRHQNAQLSVTINNLRSKIEMVTPGFEPTTAIEK